MWYGFQGPIARTEYAVYGHWQKGPRSRYRSLVPMDFSPGTIEYEDPYDISFLNTGTPWSDGGSLFFVLHRLEIE